RKSVQRSCARTWGWYTSRARITPATSPVGYRCSRMTAALSSLPPPTPSVPPSTCTGINELCRDSAATSCAITVQSIGCPSVFKVLDRQAQTFLEPLALFLSSRQCGQHAEVAPDGLVYRR